MARERQQWELTLDARQSSLGMVADFIENVTDELDLAPDAAFAVHLATDEACQNAVEHACPFDPTQVVTPRLEGGLAERNGGGLGIHFMRKMMDEVRHERHADGTNSVTMVKRGVFSDDDASDLAAAGDDQLAGSCLEHADGEGAELSSLSSGQEGTASLPLSG